MVDTSKLGLIERKMMKAFRYKDILKEIKGKMSLYMRRWYLTKLESGRAAFLHKIYRSDMDRFLHDHPWPFITFILWGSYEEELPPLPGTIDRRWRKAHMGSIRYHKATDQHRVMLKDEKPVWTLFLHGKRCREWGFQTDDGWVNQSEYFEVGSEIDTRKDPDKVVNLFGS